MAKTDQSQLEANQPEIQSLEIKAEFDIGAMVKSTGNVKLTKAQEKILFDPVPEEQVEIREDGIVYLPHIFYSGRLRKAFGWEYSVIPKGDPKFIQDKGLIVWGFHMIVKGSYMAYAIGQQTYFDKGFMTYIDACEGAKSNAIMRLCKDLGIGTELWEPEWRETWQSNWAYKAKNDKGKIVWKKKRKNDIPTEKDKDYLEIEKSIKKILDNPDFVGKVDLVDKDTGEMIPFNLDEQRKEILSRINSPKVFALALMEKIEARCAQQLLAAIEQKVKISSEQVTVEGVDGLGDDGMVDEAGKIADTSGDSIPPDIQGDLKVLGLEADPPVSEETHLNPTVPAEGNPEFASPPPGVGGETLFKDLEEEEHEGNASVPKENPKLPPRGTKLPPKK